MYLNIRAYIDENEVAECIYEVDKDFEKKLYRIFRQPTFSFMYNSTYNKLHPKVKQALTTLGEDDDMSVEQMLGTDVLTVLIDKYKEIEEVVDLVQQYTNKEVQYLFCDEE